jgi:hypothetical protein
MTIRAISPFVFFVKKFSVTLSAVSCYPEEIRVYP